MVNRMIATLWMLVTLSPLAIAQKGTQVDNPYFQSWSKEKLGTVVIREEKLNRIGMAPLISYRHYTLKESKPDGVRVLQQVFSDKGEETKELKTEYPVPARKSLPEKAGKEDAFAPYEKAKFEKMEKITVGTKTYDCRKFVLTENVFGTETQTFIWVSPSIPGMWVKVEKQEKSFNKWATAEVSLLKEIKPGQ